jgi:ammonia channel protein AmtB
MGTSEGKGKLLRNALKANGVFSGISGLVLFIGHSSLAQMIELGNSIILMVIGISLMIFSWGLFKLASKQQMNKQAVWTIIGSDLAWVLASAILVFMFPNLINETGRLLVIGIAIIVFTLAELQAWGQFRIVKETNQAY